MGTRNLTAVMVDGEYKIAQYGQWDGHPSGQGLRALEIMRETNLEEFKKTLLCVRFLTQSEFKEIIDNHTDDGMITVGGEHEKYWEENPHLGRDIGAGVLEVARDGKASVFRNSLPFAGSSLFCEFAYVIDLDAGTLEIYEGFNQEKIIDGRFVSDDPSLDASDGYEPVKLIKSYRLNDLPSNDDFIADFYPSDEEDAH